MLLGCQRRPHRPLFRIARHSLLLLQVLQVLVVE
jgi:hypothetical protein